MTRFAPCLLLLISCTRHADQCTSNADCKDPAYPFCDVYGQYQASGGATDVCTIAPPIDAALPDAATCTPGDIRACDGDQAETCNAAGSGYELDDCLLGCVAAPAPHCAYVQPTYLPDVCDTLASTPTFTVASSGSFDPNLDTNCTGGIIAQSGARDVCVVHYGTIDVASNAALTIVGSPVGSGTGRAIALVADQDLTVEGMIDVGGHTGVNGPGGGTFTSGAAPSLISSPNSELGGGGAGGATAGAAGAINYPTGSATSGTDGGAHNGGDATMNPTTFAVLVGGASTPPPPGVSEPSVFDQHAGGGGGALELISCRGVVSIPGILTAGGGGGGGGFELLSSFGGGAGGNIVIEGANVSLSGSGALFANGGAGGGGCLIVSDTVVTGPNGPDGSLSDTQPAFGPTGAIDSSSAGGNGGYVGATPTVGTHGVQNLDCPGAGGGSVGFIQTYTPAGVTPTLAPAHASPALEPNGTVQTR